MRILAIECSTRQPSVALLECNTDLSVESGKYLDALFSLARSAPGSVPQFTTLFQSNQGDQTENPNTSFQHSASQSLIPQIESGLSATNLKASDIDLVAVTRGPGSFTSLRIGVVAAKTFAFAADCQIAGVDSMRALVYQAIEGYRVGGLDLPWERVAVSINAGRGELFAGVYDSADQFATPERSIIAPGQWLASLTGPIMLTGDGIKLLDAAALESNSLISVAEGPCRRLSATTVAIVGAMRLADKGSDDLWKLEPVYFRPSAAEEKRILANQTTPSR